LIQYSALAGYFIGTTGFFRAKEAPVPQQVRAFLLSEKFFQNKRYIRSHSALQVHHNKW
jgi:hypothetical protein